MMLLYRRLVWWYLATPVFLFLLFWLNPFVGLPLFCILLFAVDHVSKFSDIKNDDPFRPFLKFLTLGFAVLVTWGALASQFWDWIAHRDIFYDLARCHWPIAYDIKKTEYLLSYHLAYFLTPSWIASFIGMHWLSAAVTIWTFMGYALMFMGYFSRSKTFAEWFFLFFLVMTFGGWDVIGYYFKNGGWPAYTIHFARWNTAESTGNIIPFYWVPQHVIPAWLSGILLFRPEFKAEDRLKFSVLLLALVAYWSPLVAMGLFAFIAIDLFSVVTIPTVIKHKILYFFSLLLVVPYYLYLSRDAAGVYGHWTFLDWNWFVQYYGYYLAFTVAQIALMVWLLPAYNNNKCYLAVAFALLLLAPLYNLGLYNALTMRGSMTGYYYLLMSVGNGMLQVLRNAGTASSESRKWPLRFWAVILLLVIASVSPLYDTIPVVHAMARREPLPAYNESFYHFILNGDYKYESITKITPVKMALLRDIYVCKP